MFDKRNRWIINLVLAIAVLSFAGVAVILPFSGLFRDSPSADSAPSTEAISASQQAELESQAKGYELVLQREPDNQTALRGVLDVRIQMGDIEGAIAPLERLAELNPDQTDYAVLLAQAKQRIGDREGAAQSYRNILASRPGDLNALQGLVDLLLQQERPAAAIGLLEDTLQSAAQANQIQAGSIDVTSVQLLLGRVYAEEDRMDEALTIYDQAIQRDRQDFRPLLGKAIVLQSQGRDEEAQPLFVSAASLAPAQYKDQINQIATGEPPAPVDSADPAGEQSEPAAPAPVAEPAPAE